MASTHLRPRKLCDDADGHPYACGTIATVTLRRLIASQTVHCERRDIDRYRRMVALCVAGDVDLSDAMVRAGWAVAYRRWSHAYDDAEVEARAAQRGVWQGTFEWPWDWRREHRQ